MPWRYLLLPQHKGIILTATLVPHWPKAYPDTQALGMLKQQDEDFRVVEIPSMLPCGEGEHVWLWIEKQGANTAWIAKHLAEIAGVKEMDVGFAGLKDRNAITQQWFSIYMPKGAVPDFAQFNDGEMTVLQQTRHNKKLRRGDLLGNRFAIRLRSVQGDRDAIEQNLNAISQFGVPNYFGEQRFGFDGGNIESGRKMLAGEIRVRNPGKKSIYLSAVRSLVFNDMVAERIARGLWSKELAGEVRDELGMATAALWGRGRLSSTDEVLSLEQSIGERHAELCYGLEHAGLSQERRAIAAIPDRLTWQWQQEGESLDLTLSFSLASGYYATSLIRELMQTQEPVRGATHDVDAIE